MLVLCLFLFSPASLLVFYSHVVAFSRRQMRGAVPVPYYQLVVPWFTQHRGEFSIVVHPNTGFEYEDHSDWALWSGQPWPLDMSIFDEGTRTNEFGRHRGGPKNPVCMSDGAVCGDSEFGPSVLCCLGLECGLAHNDTTHTSSGAALYRCMEPQ
eukprot:TRINITY_DN3436_c0_g1_i4.p1 TRINITY_DN3436_c0_g1~~TRINITY_DN3436_c0_g1_i4.p1  ORF type:complete len:154 (+),score=38.16 TRINITY_DN3436_c0_g1_i4:191-652(+)